MFLRHRWVPFRKTIYKTKIKHQCVLCKKFDLNKHMLFVPLTNHDNILPTSNIDQYFHLNCVKKVLTNPEKYSNKIIDLAIYIPKFLEHVQKSRQSLIDEAAKVRQALIDQAKASNLGLFIDEASGRISFGEKK